MKSKIRKRLLALMLCIAMVVNGSGSVLADDGTLLEEQEVVSEEAVEIVEETEEVVEEETIVEEEIEEVAVEEVVEETPITLNWSEDGVTVTVTEKVAGAIPEGTTLSVTPIVEGEEYTAVEVGLQEKAANEEYELAGFLAYDICLVDAAGNEIEPNDNVNVSIEYDEAVIPEMEVAEDAELDVTVMHFEEDTNGEVAQIVDMVAEENIEAAVTMTDAVEVEKAEFVTDSFSTFTITWTYETGNNWWDREEITVQISGTVVKENGEVISITENGTALSNKIINLSNDSSVVTLNASMFEDITDDDGNVYSFVRVAADTANSYSANSVTVNTITRNDNGNNYANGNLRIGTSSDRYKLYFVYEMKSPYYVMANRVDMEYNLYDTQKVSLNDGVDYSVTNIGDFTSGGYNYKFEGAFVRVNDGEEVAVKSVVYKNGSYYYTTIANEEIMFVEGTELYFKYSGGPDPLTTIETVDHTKAGITMKLFDYTINGESSTDHTTNNKNSFMNIGGGWGSNGVSGGAIQYNLLQSKLNEDGYPVTKGGTSLGPIFGSGGNVTGGKIESEYTVNHLFSQDIYDQTGYYEYSSFNNYAYLNRDTNETVKDFVVYDQIGTPEPDSTTDYLYNRGNFFPYNNIKAGDLSENTSKYGEDGEDLASDKIRPLYNTQTDSATNKNPNFYFGMYLEASFVQQKGGMVDWNGTESPMRYEFNGDDDLWVFIDDALVLDIGGIHVAHRGYIDFATGEVGWLDGANNSPQTLHTTTIYEMFKEAKVYPNGDDWGNGERVDEFFRAEIDPETGENIYKTFKDYTSHTLRMFYMERGDGASDLHVKFNIPVIPEGTFEVTKELTNSDKEKYSNVEFTFKAYAHKVLSTDATSKIETYPSTDNAEDYVLLTEKAVYKVNGVITDKPIEFKEDGTFYLKPGETAHFYDLQENRRYYVEEVGVNSEEFDKVFVNGQKITEYDSENGTVELYSAATTKTEVSKRPLVVYQNNCSAANMRELRITKAMSDADKASAGNDTFDFKILLENQNGVLAPYVGSYFIYRVENTENSTQYYYYQFDQSGNLVPTEGNRAVVGGTTSQDGIVSNVPVGYTVAITEILSGTEFFVDEVNLTEKYGNKYKSDKTLTEGTFDVATIKDADGAIKLRNDVDVTITNSINVTQVQVEKIWNDENYSNLRPNKVTFAVMNGDEEVKTIELKADQDPDKNWKGIVTDLPKYNAEGKLINYTVIEKNEVINETTGEKLFDRYYSKVEGTTITNQLKYKWTIVKVSSSEGNPELDGAEFELRRESDNKVMYYGRSETRGELKGDIYWYTGTPDNKYQTQVTRFTPGAYILSETKAPAGFALSNEEWKLVFEIEDSAPTVTKIVNGKAVSLTSDEMSLDQKTLEYTFVFENTPIYELPSTGGFGIYVYMLGGVMLMTFATFVLYKNRRKEVLARY